MSIANLTWHIDKWWRQWVTIEMLRELTQKSKRAERPRPSHWEDRPSSKNAKNGNSWIRLKWIYLSHQLMNLNPIFRKWGAMLNGHWFRHPVSIAENSSGPVYPHRWWQALTMKIPLRSTKRITEINVKHQRGHGIPDTRLPRTYDLLWWRLAIKETKSTHHAAQLHTE